MLEFLKENWRVILEIGSVIIALVIFLIKKPVSSSLESDLISDLAVVIANWIKQVESPGHGETKKETVINLALKYVRKRYNRQLDEDEISIWTKRISTLIELYLSTPTKKEVLLDETKTKKSQKRQKSL